MTTEERWLFFDTSALVKYVHEEESEGERRHVPTAPCVLSHDTWKVVRLTARRLRKFPLGSLDDEASCPS